MKNVVTKHIEAMCRHYRMPYEEVIEMNSREVVALKYANPMPRVVIETVGTLV